MQQILALDLSRQGITACLMKRDGVMLHVSSDQQRPHSMVLISMLQELLDQAKLQWDELDGLAVGTGPGSFTGIRIACATVAGINAQLRLPVLECSSLAISALQADGDEPLWVLADARGGEVYVGRYAAGCPLTADTCIAWSELAKLEPGPFMAATNLPDLPEGWIRKEQVHDRASALAHLVRIKLEELRNPDHLPLYPRPNYLQPSQAERHVVS